MTIDIRSSHIRLIAGIVGFWAAPAAADVTIDWATVGDPGNPCDPRDFKCVGNVDYVYRIATREVTNAQYVEFLNAKAASDPRGLYDPSMATLGGITRSGSPGGHTYSTIAGRANMPVTQVSLLDAMRFVNWVRLHCDGLI